MFPNLKERVFVKQKYMVEAIWQTTREETVLYRKLNSDKEMTLEELRELKLISNTDGRPSSVLTDEKWQKEFELRKLFVEPYGKKVKLLGGKHSKESGVWTEETNGQYDGQTNWQSYCSYINDILRRIRKGRTDYCYYIYQIMDLAKFHPNDLKTKYCDGYWEVWLKV